MYCNCKLIRFDFSSLPKCVTLTCLSGLLLSLRNKENRPNGYMYCNWSWNTFTKIRKQWNISCITLWQWLCVSLWNHLSESANMIFSLRYQPLSDFFSYSKRLPSIIIKPQIELIYMYRPSLHVCVQ